MKRLTFWLWNYGAGNICYLGHTFGCSGPEWWCEWRSDRWWKRHTACDAHLGGDAS